MNIVVLVKQVPDSETRIKIKPGTAEIDPQGVKLDVNPYDEFAVEEALQIKEKLGQGEVTVLGLGPAGVAETLRKCMAMGADKAVHIKDEALASGDSYATACAIAKALESMEYDLVLCGKQAIDDDDAAVGIEVAEMLGLPHVGVVVKLEVDAENKSAVAHSQIDGGTAVVETPLPAVITCQKGLNEPRYPALKGIMQAKRKPMEEKDGAALGIDPAQAGASGAKVVVTEMTLPPERQAGKRFEGEPAETAAEVAQLLRSEAKVI